MRRGHGGGYSRRPPFVTGSAVLASLQERLDCAFWIPAVIAKSSARHLAGTGVLPYGLLVEVQQLAELRRCVVRLDHGARSFHVGRPENWESASISSRSARTSCQ